MVTGASLRFFFVAARARPRRSTTPAKQGRGWSPGLSGSSASVRWAAVLLVLVVEGHVEQVLLGQLRERRVLLHGSGLLGL